MKPLRNLVLALGLGLTSLATSALEPVDPSLRIVPVYLFTGVQSSGTDNTGINTAITCTVYATVTTDVVNVLRVEYYFSGVQNGSTEISFGAATDPTFSFATNGVASLTSEFEGDSTAFTSGAARVLASKHFAKNTLCTARAMDSASAVPVFALQLNGARQGSFRFPRVIKP